MPRLFIFRELMVVFLFCCIICRPLQADQVDADLITTAERTQWLQTGRYAEVETFCKALVKKYQDEARCNQFGTTPEGRPMLAIIVGAKGFLEPNRNRPVAFFQGGIHAGEIDGKDAGLVLIKNILAGKILPGILQKISLVFVPVFNVDGHERFGAFNRPNQIGPEQMGWRTTSQNFNLNRDYLKVDAPEMAAMLSLLNTWDPLVYIDLHVTDGAKFQHDIAVIIEPAGAGPKKLQAASLQLRRQVMQDLSRAGHLPLWFYPSFDQEDDPQSGISTRPQSARFSNGYWALRNRLGILVESHSWRTYAHRCKATMMALESILAETARSGKVWREAFSAVDLETSQLAGQQVALSFKNTKEAANFNFQGYRYEQFMSKISGQSMTVYDSTQPQVWPILLREIVEPDLSLTAPKAGYIVPAAYREWLIPKLNSHGIKWLELKRKQVLEVEVYQVKEVQLAAVSYEKHQRAAYKGQWQSTSAELGKGSLWLPIQQAQAKLLLQLFEPASPESLMAWGFFNEIFERKEYMEAYVAEALGAEMLKDPAVQQEFAAKLASDQAFAQSPALRLEFFHRRHPSFDQRLYKYPILRLSEKPQD